MTTSNPVQLSSSTTTTNNNNPSDIDYVLQALAHSEQTLSCLQDDIVQTLADLPSTTNTSVLECTAAIHQPIRSPVPSAVQSNRALTLKRPYYPKVKPGIPESAKRHRSTVSTIPTESALKTVTCEERLMSLKAEPLSQSIAHNRLPLNLSPSSASPTLKCTFLGSLSSRHGRDLLSQLCRQIAQESKLQHHFVEQKQMEKLTEQLLYQPINKNRIQIRTPPFEMKVFFKRDQLERVTDEQEDQSYELITISGPSLIDFLLGNCTGLFRTTERSSVGADILGNVLKRRRRSGYGASKMISLRYHPRVNHYKLWRIIHRRRLGKIHQRTTYQHPRAGILLTQHQSPIVCLRLFRGLLYACSLNGQVRFYKTQTLTEHNRHRPIFTPNGGTQTLQIAHCKRFSGTVLCIAGFDQIVRLYSEYASHEPKGEIMLAAPVHCTAVKFHILFVGLGSGEVAFISLKKMCVIHTIKCSPYLVSAVAAARDPDGRHLLIASAFDGSIVVISLLNEQRRLTLTGHTKSPRQLIVDSNHHLLYSCSADKKIVVHNFLNGTILYEYTQFDKAVTSIAMNQQQHLLIASSLDGLVKIFHTQTYELIQQLTTTTSQSIISMIYKNNLVYCGMESGTIEVLQCDINEVYRCEYAACRQPFSRREDVFMHARLFHVQHSSTIQRCLWKQCMKWVPVKKFSDHLRVHTDNLVLETKQQQQQPSMPPVTTTTTYGRSSSSSITNYSSKTLVL